MVFRPQAFASNGRHSPMLWPVCISFGAHLLFVFLMIYTPRWGSKQVFMPSVIDVRMVDLADIGAAPLTKEKTVTASAPVVEQPKAVDTKAMDSPPPEAAKPEVSLAPPRKTTKTALKYKTFKTEAVKQKALKQLEQKVQTSTPKPLQDRFKELREKVAKEGKPSQDQTTSKEGTPTTAIGHGYAPGSKKEIELIDLYRLEIAYQIQKNWAFAAQLAGGGSGQLVASIVFKVLPDGTLADIFYTDRSGNPYLDESAHNAIVKSSPVKPHPPGLNRAYIEMGLRFTPEGVH
jgi:colicin import membrane protein